MSRQSMQMAWPVCVCVWGGTSIVGPQGWLLVHIPGEQEGLGDILFPLVTP